MKITGLTNESTGRERERGREGEREAGPKWSNILILSEGECSQGRRTADKQERLERSWEDVEA